MLKTIFNCILITILTLSSSSALADFKLDGKLKLTFPSGKTKETAFPFSFTKNGDELNMVVGSQSFNVSDVPKSYSFAMVLQSNNYIWLQEFSDDEFKEFAFTLGEHEFKLEKHILVDPVKGDYILTIDETDYFFQNSMAQINFMLDENGIAEISVDGMVVSLGMNKFKNPCEAFEKGSEDRLECEEDK